MKDYKGPVYAKLYGEMPFHIAIDRLGDMLRIEARLRDGKVNAVLGIEIEADPYKGHWNARGTAAQISET